MGEQADIVVVGMGVGGEAAAEQLAREGLDVVGIESHLVGGECPYWACVPSKMMTRAAGLLAEARRVPGMAGESTVDPAWAPVATRIREEATDNWDDRVAVERFESAGGRFRRGRARLAASGVVEVGGEPITARRGVIIASGTQPAIPPLPGLSDVAYWTNREAIAATEVPGSLIVLGAGAVGAELAQVFARFGSQVSLVEGADRVLPAEEPEASRTVADVLIREGIEVRTGARAERVTAEGDRIRVEVDGGEDIVADHLLVATGRRTDLAGLNAAAIGIRPDARFIDVDERMRAASGVWAVGDVTGVAAFTHVALYQAAIAVADVLGREHAPADYRAVPRVTFTDPEVGSVGLTERAAADRGLRVRTGHTVLASSTRGWIHKAGNDGFIKLVEDADRGVLVGGTSVGPYGGEVLGLLALAVHAEVPTAVLRRMIYAYPTFHRAIEAALGDLG